MSTGYPAFPTDTLEGNAGFFLPARRVRSWQEVTHDVATTIPVYPKTTHPPLKQAVVVVCAVAFVVYAVLFTNVPSMHDFFHGLRHAMGIIPCH
jgi:hypothetical protein